MGMMLNGRREAAGYWLLRAALESQTAYDEVIQRRGEKP